MDSRLVSGLVQVCIVAENMEETVSSLAENFGIGPWKCWDYKPPKILQTHRNGRPVEWTLKLAVAWIGDIQLEVIQPTSGPTVYREYIEANNEGIQHLLVESKTGYTDAIRAFESMGFPVIQGARINPPLLLSGITLPALPAFLAEKFAMQFVYHGTETAFGTVLELAKTPFRLSFRLGVKLGKPDFTVEPGRKSLSIQKINRVGIMVRNLDDAKKSWEAVGLGPWENETWADRRVSVSQLPPVKLELVEPTGDGVYRSLMDTHGPGVRYLGISGAEKDDFTSLGCPILAETERGTFIDARSVGHVVFVV